MKQNETRQVLAFRNQQVEGATGDVVRVAKGKNEALSLFLQKALERYVDRGGKLSKLAKDADVAPSLLTQIKNRGEGAGHGSAPKIAAALGLDYPVMWSRAREWFAATGGKGPIPEDALAPAPALSLNALEIAIAYHQDKFAPSIITEARAEFETGFVRTPKEWASFMLEKQRAADTAFGLELAAAINASVLDEKPRPELHPVVTAGKLKKKRAKTPGVADDEPEETLPIPRRSTGTWSDRSVSPEDRPKKT